jgi:hypothetical protein
VEHDAQAYRDEENQGIGNKCSQDTGAVVGCIFGTKDYRANNAADPSKHSLQPSGLADAFYRRSVPESAWQAEGMKQGLCC